MLQEAFSMFINSKYVQLYTINNFKHGLLICVNLPNERQEYFIPHLNCHRPLPEEEFVHIFSERVYRLHFEVSSLCDLDYQDLTKVLYVSEEDRTLISCNELGDFVRSLLQYTADCIVYDSNPDTFLATKYIQNIFSPSHYSIWYKNHLMVIEGGRISPNPYASYEREYENFIPQILKMDKGHYIACRATMNNDTLKSTIKSLTQSREYRIYLYEMFEQIRPYERYSRAIARIKRVLKILFQTRLHPDTETIVYRFLNL